jgi:antitoxin ParD1/3/4
LYGEKNRMDSKNAEKLSITLPAEMVRVIREKVASGAYGSNSEVIRDALRGWLERDRRLAALDSAITNGIADAEAGRVQRIDAVRTDLQVRLGKKSHKTA